MKIAAGMLAMALAAPAAGAELQAPQLELRPKSAVAVAPAHDAAPFVVHPSSEPPLQLLPRQSAPSGQPSAACGSSVNGLCYDPASGHIEVNARDFMPNIRGLRRETINVRRDRITFKYSF